MRLLARFGLEPIVALPAAGRTPAMAEALRRLDAAGVPVGIWPLLTDEDGYWPSAVNVLPFARAVGDGLAWCRAEGIAVRTLAFDLEPTLQATHALLRGSAGERLGWLKAARGAAAGRKAARATARQAWTELCRAAHAEGIETLAAVFPPIVLDGLWRRSVVQALLDTPVHGVPFSRICPMVYTTVLASLLGGTPGLARALVGVCGRALSWQVGPERVSLSLGLVAPGKLGDEPAFASPADLRADVRAARTSGVDDLALFSLEGALGRGPPERWLSVFVEGC